MLPPTDRMAPKVRAIVEYWRSIHPRDGLPGLKRIDPVAIPALLPHIWILDVEHDPYRFKFRLIGDEITASVPRVRRNTFLHGIRSADESFIMPTPRKGMFLDELHGGPLPARMLDGFIGIVERHEPDWYQGRPLTAHTQWIKSLERVSLPLASDGRTVDNILNLTVYGYR